ncbi:MAG TPA: DNA lyase, partial [Spirochaetota bacterium]|nr:DNA lyase [Spirochaetota bacterium]
TPQSKARMADLVVKRLKEKDLLFSNDLQLISSNTNLVRFKNNKAKYIIEAKRHFFGENKKSIIDTINSDDIFKTREWLVSNIKGYGYKEASHFLRNIGFIEDISILDRHILKNLKKYNVITEIPKTLNKNKYLEIEKKFSDFAKVIKIPLSHLDFVFWYKEAGEIFK